MNKSEYDWLKKQDREDNEYWLAVSTNLWRLNKNGFC